MRIKVQLTCTSCGSQNYLTSKIMTKPLITILLVLSVLIIIAIFMQPTKNQSSNVFDASSNDLFERSKARGFEAVMQRLTGVMIFLWLLIAMILMVLSSK